MSSTQDPEKIRQNARQREASERRTFMTQRRQELTSRIRKQKKSKYLRKKRNLPCVGVYHPITNTNPSIFMAQFKDLLDSFCRNLASVEQLLSTLQNLVPNTNDDSIRESGTNPLQNSENPLFVLQQEDESLAIKFLDHLRRKTVESLTKDETSFFQSTLRILVHLTSISPRDGTTSTELEYYGRRPLTWSDLVVSSHSLSASQAGTVTPIPSWLEIFVRSLWSSQEVELASLVIGNLIGDDGAARNVFRNGSTDFKTSIVGGLIRSVSPVTPTAAWTLTNMIRGDCFSCATIYCSETLLSASLLMTWLREPSLATQTAWMIASLAAREEETVVYLCRNHCSTQESESPFLSAITQSIQNPLQSDQIAPLVQALGNIACHASLVRPLLTETTPNLIPLLQKLLNTTYSRDPIFIKAVWLAGCLLVDAGLEHHPSTTIAAPTLIPILLNRMEGGGRTLTLEEERECAFALWNALDTPPSIDKEYGQRQHLSMNHSLRSHYVPLPLTFNVSGSTLQSLIRLINSNDSDAVIAGVKVVDLLLRRDDTFQFLQPIMQEEELPDALERICDSPMEEAGNIAADILDDFFYDERQNGFEEIGSIPTWTKEPPAFESVQNRVGNGLGRGRGRCATMPAWMTK